MKNYNQCIVSKRTISSPTRLGKSSGSNVYMAVKAREEPTPSTILSTTAATMNIHPYGTSCKNLQYH